MFISVGARQRGNYQLFGQYGFFSTINIRGLTGIATGNKFVPFNNNLNHDYILKDYLREY